MGDDPPTWEEEFVTYLYHIPSFGNCFQTRTLLRTNILQLIIRLGHNLIHLVLVGLLYRVYVVKYDIHIMVCTRYEAGIAQCRVSQPANCLFRLWGSLGRLLISVLELG